MRDETRKLIMRLAYKLFEHAWENCIYEDEELNIAVSLIEGALIIEDYRVHHVHVIFFRDDETALITANELIERYENDRNMSIDEFIESFAERLVTFYLEPRVFKVYRHKHSQTVSERGRST
ncbi:MAG: hypothetical protein QW794_01720 [Thermosphaera sp.]